jgi:hypothetical protein
MSDVLHRFVALRKRHVCVVHRMLGLGLRAAKVAAVPTMPEFADVLHEGFCTPGQIQSVIAHQPEDLVGR